MLRSLRITAQSLRPLAHVTRSIALLGLCLGMPSMARAGYIFSEIVIPGATYVSGFGIQGNIVTGYYADASGNFHGFVDQRGVVTTVDAPTSNPALSQTNLNHLNAAGNVGVNYLDDNGVSQSALYNVYTKSWTPLPGIPGSMGSGANGVNINGTVVGSYTTANPSLGIGYHGFTYNGSSYSTFDAPTSDPVNHVGTAAYDINNAGQVVGWFTDASGNDHGFIKNGSSYQIVGIAGGINTQILGENNLGQLVGTYDDSSGNEHGFLMTGSIVTTIDYPGSSGTAIAGIDDAGGLTGSYVDAQGNNQGFFALSVPEPSSIALLGIGSLSLLVVSRRRGARPQPRVTPSSSSRGDETRVTEVAEMEDRAVQAVNRRRRVDGLQAQFVRGVVAGASLDARTAAAQRP
jgi:probable HAF family extracellular repeat protein